MQCRFAAPSVLSSRAKRECDEHVSHHFAIWRRQTHPAASRGSKKSRMHMKVLSTTTLSFPTLSPLLTAGKNIVGYFLNRVVCFGLMDIRMNYECKRYACGILYGDKHAVRYCVLRVTDMIMVRNL
jgi:hypothetical protein